jgi:DNA-binding NarL/FixJ family response regulator
VSDPQQPHDHGGGKGVQSLPHTATVFVTQSNDAELAQAALSNGAKGYVLKIDVGKELWLAIEAVFQGKQFVSSGLRPSLLAA